MKENILQEADRLTGGDRNKDYGTPLTNHTTTARLWSEYLSRRAGAPIHLSAEDVCFLNILQKVSRELNAPKRDTIVDIAGYARNVEMVRDEREQLAEDPHKPTTVKDDDVR